MPPDSETSKMDNFSFYNPTRIEFGTGKERLIGEILAQHGIKKVLLAYGTDHECRTTWHAGLFGVDELLDLAQALAARGVRRWALQECRTPGAPAWALTDAHRQQLAALFPSFALRRA